MPTYCWYCCQCGNGPNSVVYDAQCYECNHERCSNCYVEQRKDQSLPVMEKKVMSRTVPSRNSTEESGLGIAMLYWLQQISTEIVFFNNRPDRRNLRSRITSKSFLGVSRKSFRMSRLAK
ncbi:hypothetical protein BDV96DRAFT_259929 [Lophiotrema nucula]|uniref:Uncharacterized protein n=1 Tax=Lophiotrema nucula TaxID=690887 RepID=A0A6A5YQP1_9PLEO|nr:hypothetical protein BDV96DRAFT_259929 [Lophiotrema nucula]